MPSPSRTRPAADSGFTLVELLVVMLDREVVLGQGEDYWAAQRP